MPDERICSFCGRTNPATQPRCIGCGQRASGSILLTEEPANKSAPAPWWQTPANTTAQVPPPPQVKEQLDRIEMERRTAEARASEEARRREETARRIAEARERLAERQAERRKEPVAAKSTALNDCLRCGVPIDDGFSFCLRCGADAKREASAAGSSAGAAHSVAATKNPSGVRTAAMSGTAARERAVGRSVQVNASVTVAPNSLAPGFAAVLSFFMPGIGQLVNGQIAKGAMLLLAAFVTLSILHFPSMGFAMLAGRVVAAVDAYRIAERRRTGKPVRDGEWDIG